MTESKLSKMEKQWQAENDVRTLQSAAQIKGDKGRMAAAANYAKKLTAAVQPPKPAPKTAKKKAR